MIKKVAESLACGIMVIGSPFCSHMATNLSKNARLSGITRGGLAGVGGPT